MTELEKGWSTPSPSRSFSSSPRVPSFIDIVGSSSWICADSLRRRNGRFRASFASYRNASCSWRGYSRCRREEFESLSLLQFVSVPKIDARPKNLPFVLNFFSNLLLLFSQHYNSQVSLHVARVEIENFGKNSPRRQSIFVAPCSSPILAFSLRKRSGCRQHRSGVGTCRLSRLQRPLSRAQSRQQLPSLDRQQQRIPQATGAWIQAPCCITSPCLTWTPTYSPRRRIATHIFYIS